MRDNFKTLLAGERRGWGADIQRIGLRCASVPYRCAVSLRNRLFDAGWKQAQLAGVPVVSVGNLTVGGTGKTPCVEYIAKRLGEWGRTVAILSRGYGSQHGPNDEALVLANNLPQVPHLQGADRVALAAIATQKWHCDALVLDDGFQHRRLARNLDLVLIDATEPWGFGYLLPRGLLRESPMSLRRAGAVMLTRCDQVDATTLTRLQEQVARLAPHTPVIVTNHRPTQWINSERHTQPLDQWKGQSAAAFCGIGNPEAFRRTLLDLGIRVSAFRAFPDHHAYTPDDVKALDDWVKETTASVVVTTQKDLVKLCQTRIGEKELFALRIQLHIDAGQDALDRKLKEALG